MYFELPFDSMSSIADKDYAIAIYLAFDVDTSAEAIKKAGLFATGQTIGTWVPLPGITQDMIENWQARVLSVYCLPTQDKIAVIRIAFPMRNFASNFAMMLTAIAGNDVSTALRIKLIDMEFSKEALKAFAGPKQGIEGLRRAAGVYGRPLVLNMIKPCLGYPPSKGSELFYQSGLGGVDLIKDDEVFGNTAISSVAGRLKAYLAAARKLKSEIGKEPVYIVNITDAPKRMREHAKAAAEEGAKAVMVNFIETGMDAFQELTEEFGDRLCFLAHYAGSGMLNSNSLGIAPQVALGILPRLAGADSVMTMIAAKGDAQGELECIQTVQKHKLPMGGIKQVMTSLGGGVTPFSVETLVKKFGIDIIIGVGGAIQGHPMGPAAGAKAVMQALQGVVRGTPVDEITASSPELQAVADMWNKKSC